jgi:hypothetical protein
MLITGKIFWSKITGNPVVNKFNPAVPHWTFDLSLSDEEVNKLLAAGMKKTYVKNKQDNRGNFLSFTRDSKKKDPTDSTRLVDGKPFTVKDAHDNDWPRGKEIGNGSTINVIIVLNERTYRGEKFLKPSAIAIQVWDLVEFTRTDGFPVREAEVEDEPEGVPEGETFTPAPKAGKKASAKPATDW